MADAGPRLSRLRGPPRAERAARRLLPRLGGGPFRLRRTQGEHHRPQPRDARPQPDVQPADRQGGRRHRQVDRADHPEVLRDLHLLHHRRQRLPPLGGRAAGHRPLGGRLGPGADRHPDRPGGGQEVRRQGRVLRALRRRQPAPALAEPEPAEGHRADGGVHRAGRLPAGRPVRRQAERGRRRRDAHLRQAPGPAARRRGREARIHGRRGRLARHLSNPEKSGSSRAEAEISGPVEGRQHRPHLLRRQRRHHLRRRHPAGRLPLRARGQRLHLRAQDEVGRRRQPGEPAARVPQAAARQGPLAQPQRHLGVRPGQGGRGGAVRQEAGRAHRGPVPGGVAAVRHRPARGAHVVPPHVRGAPLLEG